MAEGCRRYPYLYRFILCCSCSIGRSVDPRLEAKFTRYLRILSRKDLSATRRPEHISCIHPCNSSSTSPILSTDVCSLGQLAMVPELGHQPYMCLLATLLQQWARRYITVTHLPRYSPHKRARIRAFFLMGGKASSSSAVETLPTLLHLSLFLFFFGLLIFLFNINHTAFSLVAWWIGLSGGLYGCITLMPIFFHDSPYYAPLSFTAWFLYMESFWYLPFLDLCYLFLFLQPPT
ncbi:hypothetical protein BGW80DRAFT_853503, partial [Lactifluus volemus]